LSRQISSGDTDRDFPARIPQSRTPSSLWESCPGFKCQVRSTSAFNDPEHFHWTVGFNPNYRTEAHIFARHILKNKPNAKIALLFQNDGFGKDYQIGLKQVLGTDHAGMLVQEASYETSEPSVDSQVVTLQASGADVFVIAATPKFAAQAIRKSFDLGWDATRYLTNVSPSIATVLKPAGLEKSKGLITGGYAKDVNDAKFKDDPGVKVWKAFCDKYMSATEFGDVNAAYGFSAAQTMVQVLKQAGNDLSRENILMQAASLKDWELPMFLPGIKLNTSPTNYGPISQLQLLQFNGENWELYGDLITD
jgi:branched-chain amino acid transport system substrate-binding protein